MLVGMMVPKPVTNKGVHASKESQGSLVSHVQGKTAVTPMQDKLNNAIRPNYRFPIDRFYRDHVCALCVVCVCVCV